jgi:hypothetical protein
MASEVLFPFEGNVCSSAAVVVQAPVDAGNLIDPTLAVAMLQREDLIVRPMKMKCDIRYLLIEPL